MLFVDYINLCFIQNAIHIHGKQFISPNFHMMEYLSNDDQRLDSLDFCSLLWKLKWNNQENNVYLHVLQLVAR